MSVLQLSAVVFVLTTCALQFAYGGKCCAHCFGGCRRKGPGKCDGYCVPGQYWRLNSNDVCVPRCGGYCLVCTSYYQCSACRVGYMIVANSLGQHTCEPNVPPPIIYCDPHCMQTQCPAPAIPGTCPATCMTSYTLNTNTQLCDSCSTGCTSCVEAGTCSSGSCSTNYMYDPTLLSCLGCDPNCASSSCVTTNKCDSAGATCNPGYALTTVQTCGACSTGCNPTSTGCTGKGPGHCDTACTQGYLFNPSTFSCDPCQYPNPTNCALCSSAGTCDSCATGTLTAGYCG